MAEAALVEGLCVTLGGLPVLRDVSFRVAPGRAVALIGGNGSGKTTTLRAMLGLTPHLRGRVELFGQPLSRFRDWRRVGYMPQRTSLNATVATVAEVAWSGRLSHRRLLRPANGADKAAVTAALDAVGMSDRASWPMAELSGGQQQRVLLARALACEPDLLVADEPLAGVDLATQRRLAGFLAELRDGGTAILVVLHERDALAEVIDETIALRDGRVSGDPAPHQDHCDEPTDHPPLGLADPLATG